MGPLPLTAPPEPAVHVPTLGKPSRGIGDFLKISARRAFRVRIEPTEVLPLERTALAAAEPSISDPGAQAFLAWRRSVLLVIACALVPLVVLHAIELFRNTMLPRPGAVTVLRSLPVLAEAGLCGVCWWQLGNWTHWQAQRRLLAWGFAAYVLAPFVVYFLPLELFYEESLRDEGVGIFVAVFATMTLAPMLLAIGPGVIRAANVAKLLFPGNPAPGWVILLAAPIGALLAYLVVILPYQMIGSGWFLLAIAGLITAQYFLGRAGLALIRPQTEDQALATVRQARPGYLIAILGGGVFAIVGFGSLVDSMHLQTLGAINLGLGFAIGVLLVTLIATDLMIAALDRARGDVAAKVLAEDADEQLAAFVSSVSGLPPPGGA